MAEKLSAQTAAVGGDVTDDDLLYLVNDPSGTPASRKITVATLMQAAAVRELLLDYLGDTVWQSGGGITVTHSDGGNTLTLGATGVLEDLNTLGASTADGEFLVATGAGTLAWESGATARTSIGLGSVEDTALSTWAGTANVTTLGTIGTGTWQGTAIANAYVAGIDQNLLTSSSPTFVGLTLSADLVTTSTIDGVDIAALSSAYTTHAASDGSDHTFIDQSVVSGASPTFTGTNITGVPAASILAGTFGTGAYVMPIASADASMLRLVRTDLDPDRGMEWRSYAGGSGWDQYISNDLITWSRVLSVNANADVAFDNTVTATTFSGSGSSLTGVPASAITAGTFGTGAYVFDSTVATGALTATVSGSVVAGTFAGDTLGSVVVSTSGVGDSRFTFTTNSVIRGYIGWDHSEGLLKLNGDGSFSSSANLAIDTSGNVSMDGNLSITGNVTSGTWQGTAIDSAYIDQTLSVNTLTATGATTLGQTLALSGATAPSLQATFDGIFIGEAGVFTARTNAQEVQIGANFFNQNTNQDTDHDYIVTDYAQQIQFDRDGNILLRVAPSGTAGTSITWTDAIVVDQSADVTFAGALSGITTLTATTLNGTLGTAAQPNVTSLGTLTGLTVGGNVAVTGGAGGNGTLYFTSDFLIAEGGTNGIILRDSSQANIQIINSGGIAVTGNVQTSGLVHGTAANGYLRLFGDSAAATGVYIYDTGSATFFADLTLASGSITSASGAIDFGNEDLSTTGTFASGVLTVSAPSGSDGLSVTSSTANADVRIDVSSTGTGGSESARVDIGTSTREYLLQTAKGISDGFRIYDQTAAATRYQIDTSGNHDFQSGTITTTGAISGGAITGTDLRYAGTGYITFDTGAGGSESLIIREGGTARLTIDSSTATFSGAISGGAGTFAGTVSIAGATSLVSNKLTFSDTGGEEWNIVYNDADGLRFSETAIATNLILHDGGGATIGGGGSIIGVADGTLHVHTASAGAVTSNAVASDLVVENTQAGISILSADAQWSYLVFGSPSDDNGATIAYKQSSAQMFVGSRLVGGTTILSADNNITNLTLSGASGSELATFAGDVTLSAGGLLTIPATAADSTSGIWLYDGSGNALKFYQNADNAYTIGVGGETNLNFDNAGNVMLGATSTSSNAQFYATKTYSNASGVDHALKTSYTQSVATTGALYGRHSTTTAAHTSGTVLQLIGDFSVVRAQGAGSTTTTLMGHRIDVGSTNATAAVTSAYGLWIDAFTATGTITNRWGIYQAGASENNYLAGDLRIGTTSATSEGSESFRVVGSSRAVNVHASSSGEVYTQYTNDTTGTASTDGLLVGITADESALIWNYESTATRFATANTERLRIASDAYAIGIGTTDVESWSSTYGVVDFGGGAVFGADTSNNEVYVGNNAFHDGAWKYRTTNVASLFELYNGKMSWYTAASGTADTAITWSEKMRLTNGGDLGLGTTTPSAVLDVYGTTDDGIRVTLDANSAYYSNWFVNTSGHTVLNSNGASGDLILAPSRNVNVNGNLFINDTANANMTVGLTINQGANDDEAFCLKSSDCAHGLTSQGETDTYFYIRKEDDARGGARLVAIQETGGTGSFGITAFGSASTSATSNSIGLFDFYGSDHDGAGNTAALASDEIVASFRCNQGGSTRSIFLIDEDGDYHYDGADGGAFDAYQDAQMVRAFATATSKNTLRTAHDDWVQYNEQDLVDIGVLGAPVAEGGLINGAQLQRLHTGAIWQNYTMIADTRTEVEQLRERLALAENKLKQLGQA